MKIKKIMPLVFLLICSFILNGMSRVYEEKTGDEVTTHRFNIVPANNGYSITLQSTTGSSVIKQTFELDKNLSALSWTFEYPGENIHVAASRTANTIRLKGRGRGKEIDKTFEIDEMPWNQTFNIGLEGFALGKESSMKFWAIGTKGPGYMKITRFKVKRKGNETIDVNGQKVEAVYVTISLTGLLSMFWTGHYWFRQADGTFLRYKGKNGPGKPVSVMELVSESD